MPKLPKIDLEDLGVSLHTSLRKYCDSAPTSIAWNAIEIMSPEQWLDYLQYLNSSIEKSDDVSLDNLAGFVNQVSYAWQGYSGKPALAILHSSFELFSDDDWKGYTVVLKWFYDEIKKDTSVE